MIVVAIAEASVCSKTYLDMLYIDNLTGSVYTYQMNLQFQK